MYFFTSAIVAGLCYALMSMGIFISMKIFRIPDITTDGSFTLGAALSAVMLSMHMHFAMIIPAVLFAGAVSGAITGFVHTRLKVDALLAGILVMTALYSVNLSIMQQSNIPLLAVTTIFNSWGVQHMSIEIIVSAGTALLFALLLAYLLRTDFGIAMRATGSNEQMSTAMGVNTRCMKIIGLAMANACTALSGYLICQYQGFADINMGIGIVISGLGSVLIADTMIRFFKTRNILLQLTCVIAGSIVFQLVLAVALSLGVNPNLLKLVTAVFVLLIVGLPALKKQKY